MKKKRNNIIKLVAALTMVGAGAVYAEYNLLPLPQHPVRPVMVKSQDMVELTPDTVVNLRGEINGTSVSSAISELIEKRKKHSKVIYLFINSPGGNVIDGINFINVAKSIKDVKTVTIFSASMAHAIVQQLPGERIIIPTGVIMAHRASGAFKGQFNEGEVEERLRLWKKIITHLETINAARIKISLADYQKRVKDEWWSYGASAVTEGVVDSVKEFRCSNELINDVEEVEQSRLIFSSTSNYSKCPLLVYPIVKKGDDYEN